MSNSSETVTEYKSRKKCKKCVLSVFPNKNVTSYMSYTIPKFKRGGILASSRAKRQQKETVAVF